jgi:hypothetical protein
MRLWQPGPLHRNTHQWDYQYELFDAIQRYFMRVCQSCYKLLKIRPSVDLRQPAKKKAGDR